MDTAARAEIFEPVIGLEVHAQLLTVSKAFCSCSTRFGNDPNTNVCPVCLGLPGTLPVLNHRVIDLALRMGLTAGSSIAGRSFFARKNYFYPDLPKGYQISQYEHPLCSGGAIEIDGDDGRVRSIRLRRIHVEEDAGKSIHHTPDATLVDVNRCGVPLIEIVSEPDLRSPAEANRFLQKVRQIVTYLGICDGNMEEGSLRCDANVSIRPKGEPAFGTKTEVKNMNSFRNVEKALDYEIQRQIRLLGLGEKVPPETLLWDAERNVVVQMRGKEEARDYRYFPDPDLVPVLVDEEWIGRVRDELVEHPTARRDRFMNALGLPRYDADILTSEKEYADYFEDVLSFQPSPGHEFAKTASNWVMTEVLRAAGEGKTSLDRIAVRPVNLFRLIRLIENGTISGKIAKDVFSLMLRSGEDPAVIVKQAGLVQISDEQVLEPIVSGVLEAHRQQVEAYRAGNARLAGFFVGEIMKATKGKANPDVVQKLLQKKLGPAS